MLEDCQASNHPVRVKEPHFKVFPEFVGASYMKRYELFCRKLILEHHYTSASFITSASENGIEGIYKEPASDLSFSIFAKSLVSHIGAFVYGSKFLGKPYEPNAIIKNDIEFILMQRKPGGYRKPTEQQRKLSRIDKKEFDNWFRQIWNIPGASTKNHPAPFPLELATRLVRMFSFHGDTVLDPFCGTGTTMVATLKNGRNSIGMDIDPEYCRIAARYLKAESSNLFMKTKLIFEKMIYDTSDHMQVCEDQALYKVRSARKRLE